MTLKNTFLALSNILQAVEGNSAFGQLEIESQAILKFIAANEGSATEICVTDITNNGAIPGAPATKLRRVHQLNAAGWIVLGKSDVHHRRIRLQLSQMAQNEISNMSADLTLHLRGLLK
ncbi:MAG: hypothetical protein ACOYB1_10485 [Limnohabitans sp.]